MAKLTLTPLTSAYQAVPALNANSDLIEAAIENTLSRDGTAPNQMNTLFDMNSNRIINLAQAVGASDAVNLTQLQTLLSAAATDPIVGPIAATLVTIVDAGGFYTAIDVEGALQEAFIAINAISTATGASSVGVDDAAGNFAGTNVETVLAEIIADYAATTASNGASKIGIQDAGALYTATTVEAALAEIKTVLAGTGGAATIGSLDAGAFYTATDVEAILQEIGPQLGVIAFRGAKAAQFAGALALPNQTAPLFTDTQTPDERAMDGNTTIYDTEGTIHNSAGSLSVRQRLTVPTGVTRIQLKGRYTVLGDTSSGLRHIRIRKNGGVGSIDSAHAGHIPHVTMSSGGSGSKYGIEVDSGVITTTSGDFFELYALAQNGTGNIVTGTWSFEMRIIE